MKSRKKKLFNLGNPVRLNLNALRFAISQDENMKQEIPFMQHARAAYSSLCARFLFAAFQFFRPVCLSGSREPIGRGEKWPEETSLLCNIVLI